MAPNITREDLINLESKILADVRKEQSENRHNLAAQVQKGFNTIDDHEKEMGLMKKEIALTDQFIRIMHTDLAEIKDTLKKMESNLENKFASKWVEKIVIFIGSTAGAIIISSLVYLVLKK